jgi:hypothetical protein
VSAVSGEDFIDELDLTDDDFSKWDRDLEDALFKLESNRPLDAYLKEDTIRLLSDFWDLLARLDDLRSVELVGDDDEDDDADDEEEEEAKVATSPDAASPDAAAVGGDR